MSKKKMSLFVPVKIKFGNLENIRYAYIFHLHKDCFSVSFDRFCFEPCNTKNRSIIRNLRESVTSGGLKTCKIFIDEMREQWIQGTVVDFIWNENRFFILADDFPEKEESTTTTEQKENQESVKEEKEEKIFPTRARIFSQQEQEEKEEKNEEKIEKIEKLKLVKKIFIGVGISPQNSDVICTVPGMNAFSLLKILSNPPQNPSGILLAKISNTYACLSAKVMKNCSIQFLHTLPHKLEEYVRCDEECSQCKEICKNMTPPSEILDDIIVYVANSQHCYLCSFTLTFSDTENTFLVSLSLLSNETRNRYILKSSFPQKFPLVRSLKSIENLLRDTYVSETDVTKQTISLRSKGVVFNDDLNIFGIGCSEEYGLQFTLHRAAK